MTADYFERLVCSLDLEAEVATAETLRITRRTSGEQAEKSGTSLVDLSIRDEEAGMGGRVLVTFGKRDRRLELPWTRLHPGTPIVVSEQQQTDHSGWRGVITHQNRETITVVLNDSPEPVADRPLFRIDQSTDEIARQRQRDALRRISKADKGRPVTLRRRLLGEDPPEFNPPREWTSLSPLDESQKSAVDHALSAEHLAIIHGPPGTGKTTTVIELIRQSVLKGERVLACAASNLAVDNLFERLLAAGEKVIRIGHPARVLPQLREHTLDLLVESHPDLKLAREWTKTAWALRRQASKFTRTAPAPGTRRDARDEARKLLQDARELESRLVTYLLDSAQIVCATLTGLNDDLLEDRQFDLVVIDEAAQATEPACWIPLLRSRRLVLAGDHCQLPPTIISPEAKRQGFHITLMEKLVKRYGDQVSRRLTTQYRMHDQIMQFSSDQFYDSRLTGAASVRSHLLCDMPGVSPSDLTQTPVSFFDTAGSHCEEQTETEGSSYENPGEADFVAGQVAALMEAGVPAADIAVITPYSAQARRLREVIADAAVEVDTVDGFQGREKEAVVISLVRSNREGTLGFLADTRRMNVALTRARRKLIVFGDSATLGHHEFYLALLEYFERIGAYHTVWELPQP